MRGHQSIPIEEFNGLWRRGGADSCPPDHFSDCNNIQYIESGWETRDGVNIIFPGLLKILKIKNYPKVVGETQLVLTSAGIIYDTGFLGNVILSIPGMLDFGLVIIGGRAYISPSTTAHGMANQFIYVYKGDGTPARLAAGSGPVNADGLLAAANSATAGHVEKGIHIFAAVYETDTGFLTQLGPDTLPTVNADGTHKVDLSNIPVSPASYVTKVHIVASRAIDPTLYNGNTKGFPLFFIPGAIVNNGVTTLTVDFYDAELLEDASHLADLYDKIPAGVGLTAYHGRLVDWCLEPDDQQSLILVSYPGEPEAVDKVSGLLILQEDDNAIRRCQEQRDILYIFKAVKTFSTQDNGGPPATWAIAELDQGLGAMLNGVATVLNTGGTSVDYLIMMNMSGIFLFSGTYVFPELSFKIADLWADQNHGDERFNEIYNDSVNKQLYILMPIKKQILIGNYQHGLDPKTIRWGIWTFDFDPTTICLSNFDRLLIGAQ